MIKSFYFLILLLLSMPLYGQKLRIQAVKEILKVESDFQKMADEKGVVEAFTFFAAPNVVLNRSDTLIEGKDGLIRYMNNRKMAGVSLKWKPDFADASDDGTLGYTYGKYKFKAKTEAGKEISAEGVFHTVWRKQKDLSWKFVWD